MRELDELGERFWAWRAHQQPRTDRKSTRLNSSHDQISYAVFCLKKKKTRTKPPHNPNRCECAKTRTTSSPKTSTCATAKTVNRLGPTTRWPSLHAKAIILTSSS